MSPLHCYYSFLMGSSVTTTEKTFLMFADSLGRCRKSFMVSLCQIYYCDEFRHFINRLFLIIFIVLMNLPQRPGKFVHRLLQRVSDHKRNKQTLHSVGYC